MLELKRSDSYNDDFQNLIVELDRGLSGQYENHATTYAPHNLVGYLETVVIAYEKGEAVGCGCFKKYDNNSVEIKRMFVRPELRKKGIASAILLELENWAKERGIKNAVLETGTKQTEAIALYEKKGYKRTENYGPYVGVETSLCFKKAII